MPILLERIAHSLPVGFCELEENAKADGHQHITRLLAEFTHNRAMFHAVFACHLDEGLRGIGAITDEPARASLPMWRMRRVYVHQNYRRRRIANALLQEAAGKVSKVTVHAGDADATRFWEATGFS